MDLQVPLSPKWNNRNNLDKIGPNETMTTNTSSNKFKKLKVFTFEKLEKGKTEPQFLLKIVRKGSEKLDFLLILKK